LLSYHKNLQRIPDLKKKLVSGFPAPMRWRSDENVLSGSSHDKKKDRSRINIFESGSTDRSRINGFESDNEGGSANNGNNNKHEQGSPSIGTWRNKKQKWVNKLSLPDFSKQCLVEEF
jgi:hypothetical protein